MSCADCSIVTRPPEALSSDPVVTSPARRGRPRRRAGPMAKVPGDQPIISLLSFQGHPREPPVRLRVSICPPWLPSRSLAWSVTPSGRPITRPPAVVCESRVGTESGPRHPGPFRPHPAARLCGPCTPRTEEHFPSGASRTVIFIASVDRSRSVTVLHRGVLPWQRASGRSSRTTVVARACTASVLACAPAPVAQSSRHVVVRVAQS